MRLKLLILVLCLLTVKISAQHYKFSDGLYRIPYGTGSEVTVSSDIWSHPDKYDIDGDIEYSVIVAAASGWVRWIQEDNTEECHPDGDGNPCCWWFNNYVVIEHPNGEWTAYMHMLTGSTTLAGIQVGDWVEAGTTIGIEGSVGCSTGPHLHWEIGRPDDTGSPFDTIGGFLNGEFLIPVICGIYPLQSYMIEDGEYEAGPCDDNCPSAWEVFGSLSSGQVFVARADSEITTNNIVQVSYANGSSAQYRSGGSILIRPGFTAHSGSKFAALITGCNQQN